MNLGEVINFLENLSHKELKNSDVFFEFANAVPTSFDSWRGDYSILALGYEAFKYGTKSDTILKAHEFLSMCKECLYKVFTGWKGGDFCMTKDTEIYIANPGLSGGTKIKELKKDNHGDILIASETSNEYD